MAIEDQEESLVAEEIEEQEIMFTEKVLIMVQEDINSKLF